MANNICSCLLGIFLRHFPVSACLYWEKLYNSTLISCGVSVVCKRYGTGWSWSNKFWHRWKIRSLIKIDSVIPGTKSANRHPHYILMSFAFDLDISDDSRCINSSQEPQSVTKWRALSLCTCSDHASNKGFGDRCLCLQTALREPLMGKINLC
jgi:hypothetical protein